MKTWRSKWSNLHAIGDKSLSLLISIYIYIFIYLKLPLPIQTVFMFFCIAQKSCFFEDQMPNPLIHFFMIVSLNQKYTLFVGSKHIRTNHQKHVQLASLTKNTRPRAISAGSLMNQRHRWWATRRHLHPYCPMPRHVKYILRLQKCGRMKWTISAFGKMAWVGDTPSSNSHHPDFYISRSGDPKKNVHFFPLILGRRQTPKIYPS